MDCCLTVLAMEMLEKAGKACRSGIFLSIMPKKVFYGMIFLGRMQSVLVENGLVGREFCGIFDWKFFTG